MLIEHGVKSGDAHGDLSRLPGHGIKSVPVRLLAMNGAATMYIGKKSNWHALYPVPWKTREITVRVSTLDAVLDDHNRRSVDLIRMDLEGYEVEVIHGMRKTIENYSPRLLVEPHPHVAGANATPG